MAAAEQALMRGRYDRASEYLRRMLVEEPRNAQLWLRLADCSRRLTDTRHAIGCYRHASELLAKAGHHARAVAALKLALALVPDDVELASDIISLELAARRARKVTLPARREQELEGEGTPAESTLALPVLTGPERWSHDVPPSHATELELDFSLDVQGAVEPEVERGTDPGAEEPTPAGASVISAPADPALEASQAPLAAARALPRPEAVTMPQLPKVTEPMVHDGGPMTDPHFPMVRYLSDCEVAIRPTANDPWLVVRASSPVRLDFEESLGEQEPVLPLSVPSARPGRPIPKA